MNSLVIQGLGFVAFFIGIVTYQFNKKKTILILLTVYNLLFGIQYFLLGSRNSMLMCIIGSGRNIILCYDYRYSKKVRYFILTFFIALILELTRRNWNGILSLLSCLGAVLSTLAVWQQRERDIRIISLLSAIVWLSHDILIRSYAAIIDGSIIIAAIIIGIYRFDIKKSLDN